MCPKHKPKVVPVDGTCIQSHSQRRNTHPGRLLPSFRKSFSGDDTVNQSNPPLSRRKWITQAPRHDAICKINLSCRTPPPLPLPRLANPKKTKKTAAIAASTPL
ncbi:unnamed protein product, partial [Ectocarpus fasciculatus]